MFESSLLVACFRPVLRSGLAFVVCLACFIATTLKTSFAFVVRSVSVQGINRIDEDVVLNASGLEMGRGVSPYDLSESLKRVYKTSFFSDVSVEYNESSGEVVYIVTEAPLVKSIQFNGLKRFDKEAIMSEISIQEGQFYRKQELVLDAKKLELAYRQAGIASARVLPMVETDKNNPGVLTVVFDVYEGIELELGSIVFIGNSAISSTDLKRVFTASNDESMNSNSSAFSEQKLSIALRAVADFYKASGYAAVEVVSSEPILREDGKVDVTIFIREGSIYRFRKLEVKSESRYLDVDRDLHPMDRKRRKGGSKKKGFVEDVWGDAQEGGVYDIRKVEATKDRLSMALKSKGFLLSDISDDIKLDHESKEVDVKISVSESRRVYINSVSISGNNFTEDKVIRRMIDFRPGDVYDARRIRGAVRALYRTGYFQKVDIKETPSLDDPSEINIKFVLEERSTASVSGSVGYQIGGSFIFSLAYANPNFLGKGYGLSFSGEKSIYMTAASGSFSLPNAFNRNLTFGLSGGYSGINNPEISAYRSSSIFGTTTFSFLLSEYLTQSVFYSLRSDLLEVLDEEADAESSRFLSEQLGDYLTSRVGSIWFYDKRDNGVFPTKGYFLRLSGSFAGIGGNIKYVSGEVGGGLFKMIGKNPNSVLSLTGRVAYITGYDDQSVNIKDRYFLGGNYGLRGFNFRSAGPTIALLDANGDIESYETFSYGGKLLFLASLEYFFPNPFPDKFGIRTYAFADAGLTRLVDDPNRILIAGDGTEGMIVDSGLIRASVGVGFSWDSPIGKVGLSFGYAVRKEEYDQTRVIMLNFGGISI